jgi:homoserine kinase
MMLKIGVPATSANLGPGFDCLAVALDLWNEAEIEPAADFRVEVTGEGSAQLPTDENNLVIRAYLQCLESQGFTRPGGLHIRMMNRIPIGSGLGSSASAVVLGILAANTLHELRLEMGEMIRLAARMEGHADNAAAALLGGLVVLAQDEGLIYQRFEIPSGKVVVLVPDFHFPTREARAALPATVTYQDAVFNLGRVPLVVRAFLEGDQKLLARVMQDRLHELYRVKLIPGAAEALIKARSRGAAAALSGAGPGIIVFSPAEDDELVRTMKDCFQRVGLEVRVLGISTSPQGAWVKNG